MSSRDIILKRIRSELADSPPVEPPPVPEVWPRTDPSLEQLIEHFTEALAAVQGEIIRCGSMEEARQQLVRLAEESGWNVLGSVDEAICRELAADLDPQQVTFAQEKWQPQEMAQLSAGLVAAQRLLADTGSCLIECRTAQQRLLCYLPPVCVVVARTDQLAEHMPAAWDQIARQTAETDRRGEFVLVTGPSRTADIEKILILGVHGPKRLVVLLVG